jgi:hypothetical protein
MRSALAAAIVILAVVLPAAASPPCGAHCKACDGASQQHIEGARCAECEDGYLAAANGLCGE